MQFTEKQLQDWRSFEEVRQSGEFNMLSPSARNAAGLTKEEHLFTLQNYSKLRLAAIPTK